MNNYKKRAIALVICLVTVLLMCAPFANAAASLQIIKTDNYYNSSTKKLSVLVKNDSDAAITITTPKFTCNNSTITIGDVDDYTTPVILQPGSSTFYSATVSALPTGKYDFVFSCIAGINPFSDYIPVEVTSMPSPSQDPFVTPTPRPTPQVSISSPEKAIKLGGNMTVPQGDAGDRVSMNIPLTSVSPFLLTNVYVYPVASSDITKYPFEVTNLDNTVNIGSLGLNQTFNANYNFTINPKVTAGYKSVDFIVGYTENKYDQNGNLTVTSKEITVTAFVDVVSGGISGGEIISKGALTLEPEDEFGKVISAPSADYGQGIKVKMPLKNSGAGNLTDIKVTLDIPADASTYPLVMEQQSYTKEIDFLSPGQTETLEYNFRISPKATQGAKGIAFTASYKENGVLGESKFTAYLDVKKGAPPEPTATPEPPQSQPKIIIEKYEIDLPEVFAGDNINLNISFRNTSSSKTIRNLQITHKNAEAVIVPAPGGSNTIFVSSLAPNESSNHDIALNIRPDAEMKPYTITFALSYEGPDNKAFTAEESISISVAQKDRVVVDQPKISSDMLFAGDSSSITLSIFNMGKTQLNNVMVSVDNPAIILDETFFGGNVISGAKLSVDLGFTIMEVGEIASNVIVSYENTYGHKTEQTFPITFMVEEMSMPEMMPEMMPQEPGIMGMWNSTSIWIKICSGIAILLVILVIAFVIIKKVKGKKRAMELEE